MRENEEGSDDMLHAMADSNLTNQALDTVRKALSTIMYRRLGGFGGEWKWKEVALPLIGLCLFRLIYCSRSCVLRLQPYQHLTWHSTSRDADTDF